MAEREWSAIVDAKEGDDGLFVPVLFAPGDEEPVRVPLHGIYRTTLEAIDAGRAAVKSMASE